MSQAAVREKWAMGVEAKALFLVTATILAFGLAVLYSSSSIVAINAHGSSTYYLNRQLIFVAIGAVLFALAAKSDAEKWRERAWPLMLAALLMMLLVVLPFMPASVSPTVLGARRALAIPALGRMQPSEFAKLAVIVWTAMLVVKKGDSMRHLLRGMTPFLVVVGSLSVLAALEPDFSIALTFLLITGVILFTSGARIGHFLFLGVLGTPVLLRWIEDHPYVLPRLSFMIHPGGSEVPWQLKQSLLAVGSGGLLGQGYGEGLQQTGWVSFGYNDFIGSVIGEEFGFLGMVFIIGAYSLYGWLGYRISQLARTRFQQLVAVGITFTMVMTAFVHLGVVVGLLPTTGLTLPFVSAGGSNLLLSFLLTGILVNIGSTRTRVYAGDEAEGMAVART